MQKKLNIFFISSLILVLFPLFSVHAETVVRTGQNIAVDASEVVKGDYYVSVGPWSQTSMSGKVEGDMYALGGVVNVNGDVGKDIFILGGSAQMYASTSDDVRVVAGEVTVGEHVGGDLFVIGGVLKVLSSATIAGDVIFYGGTADIAGTIKGSVLGKSEAMRIDGAVGKNVQVETVKALALGDNAKVEGFLTYTSTDTINRAQNATVKGEVQHQKPHQIDVASKSLTLFSVLPLLIALFTTLAFYLLFRRNLETFVLKAHKNHLKTVLIGLCVLLFGPSLAVLLVFTGLGLLLGLMALALFAFLVLLAYTLSGVLFGSYLAKWCTNHPRITLLWVVIGTVLLQALLFVPIVGLAVVILFTTITLGTLILGGYDALT
jgi:hypothetical protein